MVRWRPTTATEDAALSDAIAAELARLRDTVETLTQGLRMMVETQGTHTEMLQAIMEAATASVRTDALNSKGSRDGFLGPVAGLA